MNKMYIVKPHYSVAAAFLLFYLGGAVLGQTAASSPQIILREMVDTYERVSSYQDSGVVRTLPSEPGVIADSEGSRFRGVSFRDDTLLSFNTYYARPGKFRFEWRSPLLRASRDAAVWSNGKQAYSWTPDISGIGKGFILNKGSALRWYVDEAQRWAGGAVYFVPSLLMKDVSPFSFGDMLSTMEGLSLLREEQIDGETCHVIKGDISGVPWVLWVGKESHLLRKTRTLYTSASFHEMLEKKGRVQTSIAEEIHRDIKVNKRIPEAVFRYRPRLGADDIDLTR
jgi:outer membrane lipoprotein-sorting protein